MTLAEIFEFHGIKRLIVKSERAGCTIQFIRDFRSLSNEMSTHWCKVDEAERVLKAIEVLERWMLDEVVLEALIAAKVVKKCHVKLAKPKPVNSPSDTSVEF